MGCAGKARGFTCKHVAPALVLPRPRPRYDQGELFSLSATAFIFQCRLIRNHYCYCTVQLLLYLVLCHNTLYCTVYTVQYIQNCKQTNKLFRIAHMATPAPTGCSCCYAQRKSRGPEGHCDGNFLILIYIIIVLRNACFRLPHRVQ